MIKKLLMIMTFILISVSSTYASTCWFNDEPNTQISDILVYDENKIFKDTLSNLNNEVEQGDFLRVSLTPTTDDENNINFQSFNMLNSNKVVDIDYRDYNNLDNSISGVNTYNYDNKDYSYLDNNYYSKSVVKSIPYNNGDNQDDLQLSVKLNDSGNYKVVYESGDSCGEVNTKELDIKVNPEPMPNTLNLTCDTAFANYRFLSPSVENVDITINEGCGKIQIGSNDAGNIKNYFFNVGTFDNENEEIIIDLDNRVSQLMTFHFYDNYNFIQFQDFRDDNYEIYSNFNTIDDLNFFNVDFFANFELYNLGENSNVRAYTDNGNTLGLLDLYNSYGNFNNFETIRSVEENNFFVINYTTLNTNQKKFEILDSTTSNNEINFKGFNNSFDILLIGINADVLANNDFNNISRVAFEFSGVNSKEFYLNKIKINSLFEQFPIIYNDAFGTQLLSKEINGVQVGNIWQDNNGNDLFQCSGNLIDFSYEGKNYKVCDTPTDLICEGSNCLKDYIIVTDENEGGIEPTQDNQKPVAILDLNPTSSVVGESIEWNISQSNDPEGSITSTKVWVDNVLFENQNSGSITSNEPKVVDFKVEVTDNEGLKDTIYRQGVFTDTQSNCVGSPIPYADIETTDLGDNQYRFEAINEFNGGESLDDLQYYWTINYQTLQGKEIISSVDFNQSVYLTLFNGCNDNVFNEFVTSTNERNPFTEPIVTLDCTQSSNTPPSVVNCSVDYDLQGYNLTDILWSYNGQEQTSNNGNTNYEKIINDFGEHTISVSVYSNAPNQQTQYYNLELSETIINETDVFGCTDENAQNYDPNATIEDDSCTYDEEFESGGLDIIGDDVSETKDNVVGLFKDMSNGITSIAMPLGVIAISIFIVLGVLALIS